MKGCAFLGVLGGAVAWPLAARGQTSAKIPRIGLLWHEARKPALTPGASTAVWLAEVQL